MLFMALTITTLFKDSKLSSQIGFLFLIWPIALQIGVTLYQFENKYIWIYTFSFLPHMPYLTIAMKIFNAYFDPDKQFAFIGDIDYILMLVILALNMPLWALFFLYLDKVINN